METSQKAFWFSAELHTFTKLHPIRHVQITYTWTWSNIYDKGGAEMPRGSKMKRNYCIFSLYLLFLIESLIFAGFAGASVSISRDDFPPEFIFGAGSSAYQVEGAAKEDGRKPSIWDTFAHSGAILDNSTGDIAADQYHKYKEDVKLMHDMGLDAYRFSISWSRLIPDGRGSVNPKGLQYYNNLIDELLSYGIEPHVTIYHFDLPQALQDEYEGLLSPRLVEDYTAYADVCFKNFGDRVKYWITFNEPNVDPVFGYDVGVFAPGHCSYFYGFNCSKGDSTRDPYTSAHNILLSHASAVALYREKYQAEQGGQIGLTIMALWVESFTNLPEDIVATQRTRDFHIGWFIDPLVNGDYPKIMRDTVGSRLPSFHTEESEKLRASFDFIGITHYTVIYLQSYPNNVDSSERDYLKDISVTIPGFLGTQTTAKMFAKLKAPGLPPLPSLPWGLQRVLNYIKVTYGNPPIMIHENGFGEFDLGSTAGNGTDDISRVEYLHGYLESLLESIRNGSNVRGYFVWSLMDCFELPSGYTSRFGLYGVDFSRPDRRRYPRLSAKWYSDFLTVLRNQASSVVIHGE